MPKIRKQVYDLTLQDLAKSSVWEFALDEEGKSGQDEATVRPFKPSGPVDESDGMRIVKASFRLADGTVYQGYLSASADRAIGFVQPIIVTPQGQVAFWYGIMTPKADAVAKAYERLGKGASAVFPVAYQSKVPLKGGPITGTLSAFLSRPDSQIAETK